MKNESQRTAVETGYFTPTELPTTRAIDSTVSDVRTQFAQVLFLEASHGTRLGGKTEIQIDNHLRDILKRFITNSDSSMEPEEALLLPGDLTEADIKIIASHLGKLGNEQLIANTLKNMGIHRYDNENRPVFIFHVPISHKLQGGMAEVTKGYYVIKTDRVHSIVRKTDRATDGVDDANKDTANNMNTVRHEAKILAHLSKKQKEDTNPLGHGIPILIAHNDNELFMNREMGTTMHIASLDRESKKKVMIQLMKVVQKMHQYGVIHRDICPHNIIVKQNKNGDTSAILIDFGNALNAGDEDDFEEYICGKPGYMPYVIYAEEPLHDFSKLKELPKKQIAKNARKPEIDYFALAVLILEYCYEYQIDPPAWMFYAEDFRDYQQALIGESHSRISNTQLAQLIKIFLLCTGKKHKDECEKYEKQFGEKPSLDSLCALLESENIDTEKS
jgi:serine/threonine protein kinase